MAQLNAKELDIEGEISALQAANEVIQKLKLLQLKNRMGGDLGELSSDQ